MKTINIYFCSVFTKDSENQSGGWSALIQKDKCNEMLSGIKEDTTALDLTITGLTSLFEHTAKHFNGYNITLNVSNDYLWHHIQNYLPELEANKFQGMDLSKKEVYSELSYLFHTQNIKVQVCRNNGLFVNAFRRAKNLSQRVKISSFKALFKESTTWTN